MKNATALIPLLCGSPSPFKSMSHFYILFFSSPPPPSSVEGLFLFPDGSGPALQQPVHQPAWPARSRLHVSQLEPGVHGGQHDAFQYERATHGHEPSQASRNEPFQPRAADAPASLPWSTSPILAHARHEENISWRGGYRLVNSEWVCFGLLQTREII